MKQNEKKKRPAPYTFRLPKEVQPTFEQDWKNTGLSLSAFIVKLWKGKTLKGQRKVKPEDVKVLSKILFKAGKISDGLHEGELRERDNQAIIILLEKILKELVLIRSALMTLMGRKP